MHSTWYVTENDVGVKIRTQLLDDLQQPVTLFAVTGVEFHMRLYRTQDEPKVAAGVCTVIDASQGIVEYAFAAEDTDAPGRYDAEWQVTFGDGSIDTFPKPGKDVVQVDEELA